MTELIENIINDARHTYGSLEKPNFHELYAKLNTREKRSMIVPLLEHFWVHEETDFNVDRGLVFLLSQADQDREQYKLMLSGVGNYACVFPVKVGIGGNRKIGNGLGLSALTQSSLLKPLFNLLQQEGFTIVDDALLDQSVHFDGEEETIYNVIFSEE